MFTLDKAATCDKVLFQFTANNGFNHPGYGIPTVSIKELQLYDADTDLVAATNCTLGSDSSDETSYWPLSNIMDGDTNSQTNMCPGVLCSSSSSSNHPVTLWVTFDQATALTKYKIYPNGWTSYSQAPKAWTVYCSPPPVPPDDDADDDRDDGDDDNRVKTCNYNAKPEKEMPVDEKALVTVSVVAHITPQQEDYTREDMETAAYHSGLIFVAPKNLELDRVHLRAKYTKRSWLESSMRPEDRAGNIVKMVGVPSIADDTLTMFTTAVGLVTFMEEFVPNGTDEDGATSLMTTLVRFESTHNFFYTEQVYPAMQFIEFKRMRIELLRPDEEGQLHVDACHKAVWGGTPFN